MPGRVPQGDVTTGTVGSIWRRERGRCQPPGGGAGEEGDEGLQQDPAGPEGAGMTATGVGNTEPKSRPQSTTEPQALQTTEQHGAPEHHRAPSTAEPRAPQSPGRQPAPTQHPVPSAPSPKGSSRNQSQRRSSPRHGDTGSHGQAEQPRQGRVAGPARPCLPAVPEPSRVPWPRGGDPRPPDTYRPQPPPWGLL